jgi:hypothetical protein
VSGNASLDSISFFELPPDCLSAENREPGFRGPSEKSAKFRDGMTGACRLPFRSLTHSEPPVAADLVATLLVATLLVDEKDGGRGERKQRAC